MINLISKLYHDLVVKTPAFSTIDKSGIIKSDHPVSGNGWIKGWVVDNGRNDTIIVCKHSNPSTTAPNNSVFATDSNGKKHYRSLKTVTNLHVEGRNLDISVCKLFKPFPKEVASYKFATDLKNQQVTVTFDQHDKISRANLRRGGKTATVSGRHRSNFFDAGDSGTPWFVWEDGLWRVASHTHRGAYGIGPWYSHEDVYHVLREMIEA